MRCVLDGTAGRLCFSLASIGWIAVYARLILKLVVNIVRNFSITSRSWGWVGAIRMNLGILSVTCLKRVADENIDYRSVISLDQLSCIIWESLTTTSYVRFTSILDKCHHKKNSGGFAANGLAFVDDIAGRPWGFLDHVYTNVFSVSSLFHSMVF